MATSSLPHVTPELARRARDHFQPFYAETLSDEDGREIATNVFGAFGLWNKWRQQRAAKLAAAAAALPAPTRPSRSTKE